MRGFINPRPKVERRCLRTAINYISDIVFWVVKIGRNSSTKSFVQVVTVIGFPDVLQFHWRWATDSQLANGWGYHLLERQFSMAFGKLRGVVDGEFFCCFSSPQYVGILWWKIALTNILKACNWGIGFYSLFPTIAKHLEQTVNFAGHLASALSGQASQSSQLHLSVAWFHFVRYCKVLPGMRNIIHRKRKSWLCHN